MFLGLLTLIPIKEQYLLQLKGFSKKKSDPFCRSQRFKLTVVRPGGEIELITTSVRQVGLMRIPFHFADG